jgi:F-type H+-transporting ATPase subunit gamma
MKMVSAAKMRGDSARLDAAKPFAQWTNALGSKTQTIENVDVSGFPKTNLFVTFSTDKGLCGGVNSYITRGMKKIEAKLKAEGKDLTIVVLGEKGRGQLRRFFEGKIAAACTDSVYPGTFANVSAVTNEVLKVDPSKYEALHLLYNEFKSAIVYIPTVKTIPALVGEGLNEPLVGYEFETATKKEVLRDLNEYLLATSVFYSAMENAASEQSARTTAMENASKNAGELIDNLKLVYNKARQTRITTELIEIISGASALE